MEAELVAATGAAKEAVYLDSFVKELGCTSIQPQPIHLSVDNKAAIDSSYNPENHSRSRHIERKHYFYSGTGGDGPHCRAVCELS